MTTSNIQRFDEITGQVLGALYENFPLPRDLRIADFVADGYRLDEGLQKDVPNEDGLFFFACIDWLSEAGYLRFKNKNRHHGYSDGVLTAKGLEVLKAVPASLKNGPSLGAQLVDASKTGTKSMLGSLAGEVLSVGSRLITSHLGLPG